MGPKAPIPRGKTIWVMHLHHKRTVSYPPWEDNALVRRTGGVVSVKFGTLVLFSQDGGGGCTRVLRVCPPT